MPDCCEDADCWPVRPLRRYYREPETEAQIRALSHMPRVQCRRRLTQSADLREETLYYFAREYNRRGDLAMARRIGDALFQRFGRHAERRIRRARFRHDDAQETLWNLRAEFWGELLCDDGSEFWEVRFWVALDRRLYRILKRERRFATVRLEAESEVSWQDRLQDRRPGPETLAVRRDALQWLTQRETKTLALIYEKGMPVEPGNLAATSVASELGVTGRTVRNYLRSARRKIRDWIAEGQTTP